MWARGSTDGRAHHSLAVTRRFCIGSCVISARTTSIAHRITRAACITCFAVIGKFSGSRRPINIHWDDEPTRTAGNTWQLLQPGQRPDRANSLISAAARTRVNRRNSSPLWEQVGRRAQCHQVYYCAVAAAISVRTASAARSRLASSSGLRNTDSIPDIESSSGLRQQRDGPS